MIGENISLQFGNAEKIEDEAAGWLWRRSNGDWRDEDQVALDAWIAESHTHLAAFWRLEATWERTARLAALRRPEPETNLPRPRGKSRALVGAIAAVIAGAGILSIALDKLWPAPQQIYSTPVGGHTSVKLADGSQIELNTDTAVRVDVGGSQRWVYLDKGEAYFAVHHDARRPFAVVAENHRISDLGTKFVVRKNPDSLKVSLIEGRARLESTNSSTSKQSALLMPGDVAIATGNTISVAKKSNTELSVNLGWRHGVVVFKDTTLADAVSELNRYNNRKLIILDPKVAQRTISGTMATTGVEAFIRAARNMLSLRAVVRGDEIVISR